MPNACGFVLDGSPEDVKVASSVPIFAGTIWSGWYNSDAQKNEYPPVTHTGNPSYFQYLGRVLSLACRGPTTVSVVFKRLPEGKEGCLKLASVSMKNVSTEISRCEVILPAGAKEDDDQTAARGETRNCVTCSTCTGATACPIQNGKWYKDTATFNIPDRCPPDDWPWAAAVIIDPGVAVRIASFEAGSA